VAEKNISSIKAAYAESRENHWHRGTVDFGPALGAHMMIRVLQSGDVTLAERMAADGYRLRDATDARMKILLQHMAAAPAESDVKEFIAAHMRGVKPPRVRSLEEKMKDMQAEALRMTPLAGGGRFGI